MRVCALPQTETLDMFQREWYRLQGEGKLSEVDMGTVPDIYLRNQQLGERQPSPQATLAPTPDPPTYPLDHPTPTPASARAAAFSRWSLGRCCAAVRS